MCAGVNTTTIAFFDDRTDLTSGVLELVDRIGLGENTAGCDYLDVIRAFSELLASGLAALVLSIRDDANLGVSRAAGAWVFLSFCAKIGVSTSL